MYLLFDIGGTKSRIAFSEDGERCGEPVVIKTPHDFEEGIRLLAESAKSVAGEKEVKAAAAGAAGVLDWERTHFVKSPNLSGWVGRPLKEMLSKALGVPVFLENDTALVGLGEAVAGAGKGHEIVAYITVSTGVGGVRITNQSIDYRRISFEPGHQIIDVGKAACTDCAPCPTCGDVIDLESMISGSAVERRLGKPAYKVPQEDPLWDKLSEWLAYGLANSIMHWSPDVVVLGGSMMVGDPNIPIERVREHLKRVLHIFPEHPELKRAELGDFGGIYGALAYVKQNIVK